MLGIISSRSAARSPLIVEQPRHPSEDNLAWLRRAIEADSPDAAPEPKKKKASGPRARKTAAHDGGARAKGVPPRAAPRTTELLLLGGTAPTDFRLRVAQAHVRHDLSPSHWSHAALLDERSPSLAATRLFEVSLEPVQGFGFPPPDNGVQETTLARYADAAAWPNIALLSLPVDPVTVQGALEAFRKQRAALDVPGLILAWLAFTWGVGSTGNPLLSGQGMPSAAVLERVIGAAQFDLTPGSVERATCPEAIWQAALWWQTFYTEAGGQAPHGTYCTPHRLDAR